MNILDYLRPVPDFPKPGILFRDISPLLADANAFQYAVNELHTLSQGWQYDYLIGIESRGLIFAAALAQRAKVGMVLARKPNKLPLEKYSESYGLEYGNDSLEIQTTILPRGAKVLLVDDVLATGGTLVAAAKLAKQAGAHISGALVILEIGGLSGAEALNKQDVPVRALVSI